MRVALVEDDPQVGQLMCLWLEEAGHSTQHYLGGKPFLLDMVRESFDLVILDWMLPDASGDQLLTWLRKNVDWPIPVIFVSARDSEEDIVHGLNLGADDYITKPIRRNEFLARLGAVLRRTAPTLAKDELLDFPPFHIDTTTRCIVRDGQVADLTQKEYELALFLFRNAGRLLSRRHLLESVWGQQSDINTRTVDTHVSRLRAKLTLLPEQGWRLSAVYNHGYRLEHLNEA